jgi:uncharacterized protein with HEPN domain
LPLTNVETTLRDIAATIESIERCTAGMDCADFRETPTTIAAVEHVGNWLPKRHEWNWLSAVWKAIRTDLPPLKATVLRALDTPAAGPPQG